jgi:hypothetical protein
MDKEKLHILQHSLGLDQYGNGRQYRNHYVAGGDDVERCRSLVSDGYMVKNRSPFSGGDPWFSVAAKGIDYVALNSPAPPPKPKLTRSQERYQRFLHSDCGLTFGEWIGTKWAR